MPGDNIFHAPHAPIEVGKDVSDILLLLKGGKIMAEDQPVISLTEGGERGREGRRQRPYAGQGSGAGGCLG